MYGTHINIMFIHDTIYEWICNSTHINIMFIVIKFMNKYVTVHT